MLLTKAHTASIHSLALLTNHSAVAEAQQSQTTFLRTCEGCHVPMLKGDCMYP